MAENLAKVCSSVLWNVELVRDDTGYLGRFPSTVFKECLGSTWLLIVKWKKRKTNGIRNNVKQKGTKTYDLENSQTYPYYKKWESLFWREYYSVAEQSFDKEISVGLNHGPNQPFQQKHCQCEQKGKEKGQNEGKLRDLLRSHRTGPYSHSATECAIDSPRWEEWSQRWFRDHQGYILGSYWGRSSTDQRAAIWSLGAGLLFQWVVKAVSDQRVLFSSLKIWWHLSC